MNGLAQFRLVAGREVRESMRRRSVRIVLAVLAVASTVGVLLPELIGGDGRPTYDVLVADELRPALDEAVAARAEAAGIDVDLDPDLEGDVVSPSGDAPDVAPDVEQLVRDGDVDAAVEAGTPPVIVLRDDGSDRLQTVLAQAAGVVGLVDRLTGAGLGEAEALDLAASPPVDYRVLDTDDEDEARGVGGVAAVVTYLGLLSVVVQIANGTAVEKASRISEVLLAIVRPGTLLFGKVAGVAAVSLAGVLALLTPVLVKALLGGSLPASTFPTIGATALFFVLGLAFYAPVSGALGALVERQEEVGTAMQPITILLVGGFFASTFAVETDLGAVLAYVPVTAPLVVPSRVSLGIASGAEVALAAVVLAAAAAVAVRIGGSVYRRAIVRTGRRLRVRDVLAR